MSDKIIIEDHSNEDPRSTFNEDYAMKYASELTIMIIQDGVSIGLSPREIIHAMFLASENLLGQSVLTDAIIESECSGARDWAKVKSNETMEKLRSSGVIEKLKEEIKKLRFKKEEDKI